MQLHEKSILILFSKNKFSLVFVNLKFFFDFQFFFSSYYMIAFYIKFVSNARSNQQKPRLRLGFSKVGRTYPCPLQNSILSVLSAEDQEK